MRSLMLAALLLAAAAATPAGAQFEDLIHQGQALARKGDAAVTLDLRAVAADEVVKALAEATRAAMRCDARLAKQKVTLAIRKRPAREVAEALAIALDACWRQDGKVLVLEPEDPLETLTSEETSAALRLAFLLSGVDPDARYDEARSGLGALLGQILAGAPKEGIPVAALPPDVRRRLASVLSGTACSSLGHLMAEYRRLGRLESDLERSAMRIERRGTQEFFMSRGPAQSVGGFAITGSEVE